MSKPIANRHEKIAEGRRPGLLLHQIAPRPFWWVYCSTRGL